MNEARYDSAIRFIRSREFFGMKLGLANVREFVEYLGQPQDTFPVVHIAGTNGKGSTVKMLGSILTQAGYKTGVFTSPHLVDFRERITINGQKISKRFVSGFIERHKAEIVNRKITYFEVLVALALSYFAQRQVEIAVMETGLGGRLDATNILAPLVCAITEISRDHTRILGDTISQIAREKGGIIKPSVPVALGVMPQPAERILRKIASSRSARVLPLVSQRALRRHTASLELIGDHQRDNLRLALTVLRRLKRQSYSVANDSVNDGLRKTHWKGRFQIAKAPSGARIILDVAHNETGLEAFVKTFRQQFPNRRAYVIAGFAKQKDHTHALKTLSAIAHSLTLTGVNTRRSADPLELKTIAQSHSSRSNSRNHNIPLIRAYKSSLSSFRWAYRNAKRNDLIVIVGSHYLVGEFLRQRNSI